LVSRATLRVSDLSTPLVAAVAAWMLLTIMAVRMVARVVAVFSRSRVALERLVRVTLVAVRVPPRRARVVVERARLVAMGLHSSVVTVALV
jgi:hypothetical protein